MIIEELSARLTLDDAQAQTKLGKFTGQLDKMGSKLQGVGKRMSLFLTAPIVAAGVAMVKTASDAAEIQSKYNAVFSSMEKRANAMSKEIAKGYGMSIVKTREMMGATGDLLTGFGFTQDAALDLASQVAELGADLASFTNYSGGAEGASEALTKALLGEREMVKNLGIAILESDVKAKMLEMSQQGVTFETERQAKAYATLLIAQEQSKNAIGDYDRTSGSLANQMRVLKNRFYDLRAILGEKLIPVAIQIIEKFRSWTEAFIELDNRTKTYILILAGVAAAIGPLLIGIGSFMKAIKMATLVMHAFNLTNPAGWIILIGAALATATYFIVKYFDQISTWTRKMFNTMKEYLVEKFEWLVRQFDKGVTALANAWNWLKSVFTKEEYSPAESILGDFIDKLEESADAAGAKADLLAKELEKIRTEKEKLEKEAGSIPGVGAAPTSPGYEPGPAPGISTELSEANFEAARSYEVLQGAAISEYEIEKNIAAARADILQEQKQDWLEANADLVRAAENSTRSYNMLGKAGEENLAGIDAATTALMETERKHQAEIQRTIDLEKQFADIFKQAFQDSFEALGEAMIKGEEGWESLAEVAKEMIAKILEALGQRALVEAGIAFAALNIPQGIAYGAAAAAAFAGAGIVRALKHGGVITEPIVGRGLHSGATYAFGEGGPEEVVPLRGGGGTKPMIVQYFHIHGSILTQKQLQGFAQNATRRMFR